MKPGGASSRFLRVLAAAVFFPTLLAPLTAGAPGAPDPPGSSPESRPPDASPAAGLHEDIAWLDARVEAARHSGSPRSQARTDLIELQRRLEARGYDRDLARALAPSSVVSPARVPEGRAATVGSTRPEEPGGSTSPGESGGSTSRGETGAGSPASGATTAAEIAAGNDTAAAVHALRSAQRRLELFEKSPGPVPREPSANAAARARAILDGGDFDLSKSSRGSFAGLFAAIDRFLGWMFGGALSFSEDHPGALKVAALALIVLAVLVIVRTALRSGSPAALRRIPSPAPGHAPSADGAARARALLAEGLAALEAGRILEGLKLLEASAVASLRERGLLPVEPGLTDQEGLRLLARAGASAAAAAEPAADSFRRIAAIHERIVYGGRSPRAEELSEAAQCATALAGPARPEDLTA